MQQMPLYGLPIPKPNPRVIEEFLVGGWRFADGFVDGLGGMLRDLFRAPFTGDDLKTTIIGGLILAGGAGVWRVLTSPRERAEIEDTSASEGPEQRVT